MSVFSFLGDYKNMGERHDKRLGLKSQLCWRKAGNFEKVFYQFGPQFQLRKQF